MSKRVWDKNSINQLTSFVENHSSNCVKTATRALSRDAVQLFGRTVSASAAEKAYYKYRTANGRITQLSNRNKWRQVRVVSIPSLKLSMNEAIAFYRFCRESGITIG